MFTKGTTFVLLLLAIGVYGLTDEELKSHCKYAETPLIAHPEDPHKYIVCSKFWSFERTCADDLCFNVQDQKCEESCKPPQTDHFEFVKKECHDNDLFLVPFADNVCHSYYVCLGKETDPINLSCPDNKHWSETEKRCKKPVDAGCQTVEQICERQFEGFKTAASNCYQYYECKKNVPVLKSCKKNQHFDEKSLDCISKDDSTCVGDDSPKPKCSKDDKYIAHEDCDKFYRCYGGFAIEGHCPPHEYYDDKKKECRKDHFGKCKHPIPPQPQNDE